MPSCLPVQRKRMRQTANSVYSYIRNDPSDYSAYVDLLCVLREMEEKDFAEAHKRSKKLRSLISGAIDKGYDIEKLYPVYRESLLFDARTDFDSYMLYLEIDRPPDKRFYQPRRKILRPLVKAMQALLDDELDELFLAMPPRVGKTTLLMFFNSMLAGLRPESSNLYVAYSDTITGAFYNGVLEVIGDPDTYKWHEIFPECKLAATNSQKLTININRKKRYPTVTSRSLYGTLNGACDCDGFLISDDLIGGIEEALNKDRLDSAWAKVDNNMLTRAKEHAKILWCGTRWSVYDPAGRRMALLENNENFRDKRYKVINVPALNGRDESNFDYDYDVGYSTQKFRERRASFEKEGDMASWLAQYQQEPIEREGTLFSSADFRFWNGVLPEEEPDRVFMAVDPSWGGGDFCAAPVCVQYGEDLYIIDVVYTNEDKRQSVPMIVNMVERYNVAALQVEATKTTESFKEEIENVLKDKGIRLNITSKPAGVTSSKEQRIFDKAPDIREHMIFLENGKRSRAYEAFMNNVYSFKMFAKNKHDDAPDSLAQAISMMLSPSRAVQIFRRTF